MWGQTKRVKTIHPQKCHKREQGQAATVRSFRIRLALPLLGRVRVRDCPGLPGAVLGHVCCSGKILNNPSFILKSFPTWSTNYMLTLLVGGICYFEGRGLKPCWSQSPNVPHPETGCTLGSEMNSRILQAGKLWLRPALVTEKVHSRGGGLSVVCAYKQSPFFTFNTPLK